MTSPITPWTLCFFAVALLSVAHAQQPTPHAAPVSNVTLAGSVAPVTDTAPANNAAPATTVTPPNITTTQPPKDSYVEALRASYLLLGQNKLDAALDKVNTAIQLNPKGLPGYVLRGSIYSGKKIYDKAQQDFEMALQIDATNSTVKFNLAEIKFVQKEYDAARPEFASLATDKDDTLRDLAAYKVFLCDLFGAHTDVASKELDAFNQVGSKPSYYFGNAAWDLFNHKPEDARGWLASGSNIYSAQKSSLYASSLFTLGYLPLPSPPPK